MPESASPGGVSFQLGGVSIQLGGSPSNGGECIPVGCVPADRRPYAGVCFPGGFTIQLRGSPSSRGGFSIQLGGSPSNGRGWVLHPAGGGSPSSWGGGFSIQPGGFSIQPGVSLPDPPPVNRMTDRCKNITLAKTSFRPVIILEILNYISSNLLFCIFLSFNSRCRMRLIVPLRV